MKKFILAFCLTTFHAFIFAQPFSFGLKAGLNMSNSDGYDQIKNQYTPGFNAGGLLNIDFKSITIQPGVFFTTKGQELPQQTTSINFGEYNYIGPKYVYTLDYIEESVVVLYNAPIAPDLIIQLGGGPYVGQGISAKVTTGQQNLSAGFTNSAKVSYRFKNPDYGLNLIGGIELKKKFLADLEYSQGFANVSNESYPSFKNSVFSISLGYLFR
jgi:outer membrane protein with beta-barrel domain